MGVGGKGGAGEGQGITEALGSGSRYGSQRGSKEAVPSFKQLSPLPELTGQVFSMVMGPPTPGLLALVTWLDRVHPLSGGHHQNLSQGPTSIRPSVFRGVLGLVLARSSLR